MEAVIPLIGDGARLLVERALRCDGTEPDAPLVDRTLAIFGERYAERPVVNTTLLPGAREALSLGLPAALVTNKPRAVTLLVLESLGISASFGAIYAGGDGPLKPAPDGLLAVAAQLGVAPSDAWMIGDGPQDVLAGRAAGTFTIAVPGIAERGRVLAAGPDLVVGSLHDVAQLALRKR
jgi:phosphoglycolate phosphatase